MTTSGDARATAAVVEALRGGPRDVLGLGDALRRAEGALLAHGEGHLHVLLHRLLRRGVLRLEGRSPLGLVRYALSPPDGPAPTSPAPVSPGADVPAPAPAGEARTAARIASAVRDPADRGRVTSDVLAHLAALRDAGRGRAFGSARAVRHYLRRVDRGRPTVCFAASTSDRVRRFLLHEGPWILAAVLAFLLIRAYVAEIFVIPSTSMVPTLLVDDRVLVLKPGGKSMPERWQIVTFSRNGVTYVKRVGGLGGEAFALVDGDVYVDGKLEVKPDDVREALRFPYASWDLGKDGEAFERVEEGDGFVWRLRPERRLWSRGPRARGGRPDVRLRDGYATLSAHRAPGERLTLELRYTPPPVPDEDPSPAPYVVGLRVDDEGAALFAHDGVGGRWPMPASQGAPPPAGPLVLRLSQVDGIARAEVGGWRFEAPASPPRGWALGVAVRASGPSSRPGRLVLEKDLHYSLAGHHAVPDVRSDEDPRSYAYEIPAGHVFLLGDNTHISKDSRYRRNDAERALGPVAVEELIGPVRIRVWPPGRVGGVR